MVCRIRRAGLVGQYERDFILEVVGNYEGLIQSWHTKAVRCSKGYRVREACGRAAVVNAARVSFPTLYTKGR